MQSSLRKPVLNDLQPRGEVDSLLAQQADSFLESAPISAVKALNTGARLGHFEIVKLIGQSGMRKKCLEGARMTFACTKFSFAVWLLSLPGILTAQQLAIARYDIPTLGAGAKGITLGADGALWFTEVGANKIGQITTAGAIAEYHILTAHSGIAGIVAGPDGAVWFTESAANKIGRITLSGAITEFPLPTAGSSPWGITAGRDGAVWFTEAAANRIGRITVSGAISEYSFSQPSSVIGAGAIATGPDGALWVLAALSIIRITTPGETTVYQLPRTGTSFEVLGMGPDGSVWFGGGGCQIGRLTTSAIATYNVPCAQMNGIAAGADGAMWFTNSSGDIGRITQEGALTLHPLGSCPYIGALINITPWGITAGPDGELWFAADPPGIGQAFFVTAGLSASPDSGFFQTSHTFTGTGYAPNETVQIFAKGIGSPVLVAASADSTGSFSVLVRIPQSPNGPRVFVGAGLNSHKLGAASFTVTPNLILSPESGSAGTSITAWGYGFPPFTGIDIYWGNPRTLLATTTTDSNGTLVGSPALTFAVPTGAATGTNRVLAGWGCNGGPEAVTCVYDGYGYFDIE